MSEVHLRLARDLPTMEVCVREPANELPTMEKAHFLPAGKHSLMKKVYFLPTGDLPPMDIVHSHGIPLNSFNSRNSRTLFIFQLLICLSPPSPIRIVASSRPFAFSQRPSPKIFHCSLLIGLRRVPAVLMRSDKGLCQALFRAGTAIFFLLDRGIDILWASVYSFIR
jgi:hypothetical protein